MSTATTVEALTANSAPTSTTPVRTSSRLMHERPTSDDLARERQMRDAYKALSPITGTWEDTVILNFLMEWSVAIPVKQDGKLIASRTTLALKATRRVVDADSKEQKTKLYVILKRAAAAICAAGK